MEDTWDNNRKIEITEDPENFIIEKRDGLFHIGQCYDEEPALTLYCKKCGRREFNVGRGSYFTGIKCINCGWESMVHTG